MKHHRLSRLAMGLGALAACSLVEIGCRDSGPDATARRGSVAGATAAPVELAPRVTDMSPCDPSSATCSPSPSTMGGPAPGGSYDAFWDDPSNGPPPPDGVMPCNEGAGDYCNSGFSPDVVPGLEEMSAATASCGAPRAYNGDSMVPCDGEYQGDLAADLIWATCQQIGADCLSTYPGDAGAGDAGTGGAGASDAGAGGVDAGGAFARASAPRGGTIALDGLTPAGELTANTGGLVVAMNDVAGTLGLLPMAQASYHRSIEVDGDPPTFPVYALDWPTMEKLLRDYPPVTSRTPFTTISGQALEKALTTIKDGNTHYGFTGDMFVTAADMKAIADASSADKNAPLIQFTEHRVVAFAFGGAKGLLTDIKWVGSKGDPKLKVLKVGEKVVRNRARKEVEVEPDDVYAVISKGKDDTFVTVHFMRPIYENYDGTPWGAGAVKGYTAFFSRTLTPYLDGADGPNVKTGFKMRRAIGRAIDYLAHEEEVKAWQTIVDVTKVLPFTGTIYAFLEKDYKKAALGLVSDVALIAGTVGSGGTTIVVSLALGLAAEGGKLLLDYYKPEDDQSQKARQQEFAMSPDKAVRTAAVITYQAQKGQLTQPQLTAARPMVRAADTLCKSELQPTACRERLFL